MIRSIRLIQSIRISVEKHMFIKANMRKPTVEHL